ncbi:ribonuclease R [Neptuniibacter caesariensis]|uniref:Ribonuclease R n=1 Tax=Neptuniibacter caesariensis TaxID=207954 RepID=A0A7U8C5G6_NEPCE|nr:ribonuclease R [Neptuniibacter caesariensis]EAR60231.1 ribonuclease R [Oceanospirillum sp. MED92] [Neptuniibacter caesariensis]
MSKDWIKNDPEAAAEAEKYSNPVPSREYILQFIQSWGAPIGHAQLCEEMQVWDPESRDAVFFRLKAMCRDGQLMSNRRNEFALLDRMSLIKGRVIGHRDGFGFVKPEEGGDDLKLSPRQMRQVFDGDKVLVQEISVDFKGRREGKIVEILERNTQKLVGRFSGQEGFGYLRPENQRITQEIMVVPDPENPQDYKDGQLVVAELVSQPSKRELPQARVVEVLGDHMAPGMEITVAIHNYDIPHEWPDEVRQEVGELAAEVEENAKQNRVDLRDLPLVTIDGEDAKDFDDAVYAERKKSGGWRLWVAIADVSWYVRPGSELDNEAFKRSNSTYFPEFVVPMLPELLSNGLCSLNPHVDRLAMVCEMTISESGNLSGYKFYEAVIQSHARLTYTKVGKMLMQPDEEDGQALRAEYASVLPHLEDLYSLYFALRKARDIRGAIDFETTETRMVFGEDRKIDQIIPVYRNDAHKLIEECMLCANVATARFLEKLKIPAIYRVHEGPKEQKLENLRAYLGELGLNLGGAEKPEPKHYQQLAEWIDERPDKHLIQTMMLRSMQQAVYSPDNQGHFGLAYPAYTHFTSPIRRYPDLLVHRLIRAAIHSQNKDRSLLRPDDFQIDPDFTCKYSIEQLLQLGEHCSMTERRSDEATRDVVAWLKCEYMQDHVGDEYEGVISAVTGFGVFVELDQLFVEGLVHITALPGDYYVFDQAKQRLVGERTRKNFRLGDRLTVKVVRVDLDERKIDFELVEQKKGVKKKSTRELLAEGKLGTTETKDGKLPGARHEWGHKPAKKDSKVKARRGSKREALLRSKKTKDHSADAQVKKRVVKGKGSGPKRNDLSQAEQELMEFSGSGSGKSNKSKKRKVTAKPKLKGKKKGLKVKKPKR